MSEIIEHFILGMSEASTLSNIGYALVGSVLGTAVGVLPGLGPSAALALLLPTTYGMPATPALILLSCVYYGAQYGGSTTSILLGVPGEASSVVTTIDGHAMALRGRAADALLAAGLASFFAAIIVILLIFAVAPALSLLAFQFGPEEYCAVAVLSLIAALLASAGPRGYTLVTCLLGGLLGLVGTDVNTGQARLTIGLPELLDGISFMSLSIGLFGYSGVLAYILRPSDPASAAAAEDSSRGPEAGSKYRFNAMWPAAARGTLIGTILGLLPGGGTVLASFVSYTVEKRIPVDPKSESESGYEPEPEVGRGNIRGVAGPEAANNGAAQSAFIPMLVLGIPPNASTALMLGAMTLHNIQPGPQVMSGNPTLFWGLMASMLIGNVVLLLLNVPLIGIWTTLLRVPQSVLMLVVFLVCTLGIYATSSSPGFDLALALVFGVLGYAFDRLKIEPTALLLAFVLAPMVEENLSRALVLQHGDPRMFVTRPISGAILTVALLLLVYGFTRKRILS